MTLFNKAEIVELYGSEKCKAHFDKYGRFQNKNLENSLIKTIEQYHYGKVELVKVKGVRGNQYEVGDKRKKEDILAREDGNATNGNWSIKYSKNMDVIVVASLEAGDIESNSQTMRKWLLDFGIINRHLFDLMSKYDGSVRKTQISELTSAEVFEYTERLMLNDYLDFTKELMGQLESTLNRMRRANIIRFFPVYKAKLLQTGLEELEGIAPKIIELKSVTLAQIDKAKAEIMTEYDITAWEWENLTKKAEVVEAKKAFANVLAKQITDEEGNHLPISFYWMAWGITLKATQKRIKTYLNTYNAEAIKAYEEDKIKFLNDNLISFKSGRLDRVAELAKIKEQKFFAKHPHDHKIMGRRKPVEDVFEYSTAYYKLFFNHLYVDKIKAIEEYYNGKSQVEKVDGRFKK